MAGLLTDNGCDIGVAAAKVDESLGRSRPFTMPITDPCAQNAARPTRFSDMYRSGGIDLTGITAPVPRIFPS